MKIETKRIITLAIVMALIGMTISPIGQFQVIMDNGDSLSMEELAMLYNAYPLIFGDAINDNYALDWDPSDFSTAAFPSWSYGNTWNFTNSQWVFGNFTMEPEEVSENLRNMYYNLLYNDIEAACQTSILDIMLLRGFDSLILKWLTDAEELEFMGYCSGMSQVAREYYLNPSMVPLGLSWAYDMPRPDPNATIEAARSGDVTEAAILEWVLWRGSAAFFNPNHLLNWIKIYLGIPMQSGGTSNTLELDRLRTLLMLGEPVTILMTQPAWVNKSLTTSHFVVAYEYDTFTNGSTAVYIYDNRYHWESDAELKQNWLMFNSQNEFDGTHKDPDKQWNRMCVYERTCEYNSILTLLLEVISDLVGIFVHSPVDIEITDPMGRTIGPDSTEFPAIYIEDGEETFVMMPYAPGFPYLINLTGTGTGHYSMDINKVVDGQLVTDVIEGETVPGQSDVYSAVISEEGVSLSAQGVALSEAHFVGAGSVELDWSRYDGGDFAGYEIYMSETLGGLGNPVVEILDQDQTSYVVTGIPAESTVFFTVRVKLTGDNYVDSNQVGAATGADVSYLLWIVVGAGAVVMVLVLTIACRKRRQ